MTSLEFTVQIASMRPTLQAFTRRFTLDREESHDLVQDTMLKALTYRDKFRQDTNLKGWLFTIMRNTFINNYRRSQRARTMQNTPAKELVVMTVREEHTFKQPQESMEFKELWRNMNKLKDELLTPFRMHISGYKYHEIADELKIPIGTVKNRIFHARKEIQKNLSDY